jgi:hypothetical protein
MKGEARSFCLLTGDFAKNNMVGRRLRVNEWRKECFERV